MEGVAQRVLCPVLVRRDEQLAVLEDALLEARRGRGRLVVLAGEAGIGKTRLAGELAQQARRLGMAVLSGSCSEAELSLPYLPFVEAIGNYLGDEDAGAIAERLGPAGAELGQLFPQFGGGRAAELSSDPGQAKLRLYESIVSLLAIPAQDRTLLLILEDVHWADDSSRHLLDHIARRLAALRALVLVTYRSDELHRRHPFLPTVRAWRRSGLAEVVDLDPLPEPGVAEMIARMTGTEAVDPELLELMYERTEGNPFVLEEMLSDAAEGLEPGERWSRDALERVGIPETVRDTILQRVARLDPEHVATLEAAAVLGRSFDYPTLFAVSEADRAVVHSALETAVAQLLVEEHRAGGGRYQFRHALTQEAIYDDIVTPRRQAMHSRAADVLGRGGSTRPVDLAHHLLGAGRFEEAVPIYLQSAEEAEHAVAYREAAALLERALPHLSDPVDRARTVCQIGHDRALNGEPGPAQQWLSDGVEELERLDEPVAAARYRVILGRCFWERSQPDHARAEYERAREVLAAQGPSAPLAMAYVRLAGLHAFQLEYERCLEAAGEAVAIAEEAGADFERLYALGFLGLGHLDAGQAERGFEIMNAAYAEAREKDYWSVAQNVTWNDIWSRVHMLMGGLGPRLERFAAMPSWPLIELTQKSARSYVLHAAGELRPALEDAEQGILLNERLGYRKMVWRSQVHLAEILVELGRHDEAKEVLPAPSTRTELQDIVYDGPVQVRCRLARGEVDEAVSLAREIRDHAGRFALYHGPLAVAVEAFVAAGDLDAAQETIERAGADADSAFFGEMLGRVALARGEDERAVAHLRAAVEAMEGAGYPLHGLRARVPLAEAEARAGEVERGADELRAVVDAAGRREARLIADEARAAAGRLGVTVPETGDEPPRARPEPVIQPAGERLVTFLFADVRGYTDLSAAETPAEIAELMATLYRFARSAVERHGGVVDKFAGDAVMASFNISGTSVDHAVDALETGLTLRDKAALMDLPLGIGIATGAAILGRGASDQNMAITGVATNLAARLQTAAAAGEILLSEETHRRVEPWLAERGLRGEREELRLKGFAGAQIAHRLAAPAAVEMAAN
jgi:class 3 adenylate cyclase